MAGASEVVTYVAPPLRPERVLLTCDGHWRERPAVAALIAA